jgi:catechol 2,3-dioxygenase
MTTALPDEPVYDIAQLGHTELLSPVYEESLRFFVDIYGLDLVAEEGGSAYLRGWGDTELTTLKLTPSEQAGLGHVGWRAVSPQALDRRVAALREGGLEGEWIDGDVGHGKAYRFRAPSGQLMEVYYESEKYRATGDKKPYLPNQPQAEIHRGVGAQRIDHLNILAQDVRGTREILARTLGFKLREYLVPPGKGEVGAWLSLMNKAHDLAITREEAPVSGRLHHVAYAVENREDVLRAADTFIQLGQPIEFGPAKHSRTQGFFLYVLEPGGNRIEVFSGGIHIYAPDWEAVRWTTEAGGRSTAWGLDVPPTFHGHATPVLS